ncbi:glycoside hydrolase family 57 protein [Thiolinea disciformis]|uniref:glycoside hydrolase family 57 protein n=1 Tax=Thiolinea disciformis TaxID=125614 RepID=UPI00036B5A82|nr:glycoside hydrolase family 57 protein [Thiolinea disciformis]
MGQQKLNVVLCWHMHQPWYRDGLDGDYRLPWVYLHAMKDYSDMATHLEQHPRMRLVVNFSPVLLEQINDYAHQLQQYLQHNTPFKDRLLNLLAGLTPIPSDVQARSELIEECQRCHAPRMIHPYPCFQRLLTMIGATDSVGIGRKKYKYALEYLSDQYFLDLLTWYHLSWLGQALKLAPAVQTLMNKGSLFNAADRRSLLSIIHACVAGIIPRYRALAERGQIELSMTPYMHPIMPLLEDFHSMNCAQPDAPMPSSAHYPGGTERTHWHMEKGIAFFQQYFGQTPRGVWLSEGAVSDAELALLDKFQINWTATGEGVWRNSCQRSSCTTPENIHNKRALFMPYRQGDNQVRLFFRDDGLSDLIGFKYSTWNATDAVADFVQNLENIRDFLGGDAAQQVVSIILDGENAWEYYPENAYAFLDSLYSSLTHSEVLQLSHFSDLQALPTQHLPNLCAGSWVYGSFSTWIGSPDKNRGWDYLVAAKQAFDTVSAAGTLSAEQQLAAERQLAVCEGSDWFWWFGDYNPADSVSDFEQLYRQQLMRLYDMLGLAVPEQLHVPLSTGNQAGAENAGTMRRNKA